jgi:hypothetical protein
MREEDWKLGGRDMMPCGSVCDMHCGSTKIVGLTPDEMTLVYKNKNQTGGNNLIFYCM